MSEHEPEPRGHSRTNGGAREKKFVDALLMAAVLGLVGAVWNLTQSVAVLRTAQESLQRQVDREVARLERRQDTLEGHITRGEVGTDAPDKQR